MIKTAERLDSKVEDLMLSYLKVKNEMKEAREEWLKCLIIRER